MENVYVVISVANYDTYSNPDEPVVLGVTRSYEKAKEMLKNEVEHFIKILNEYNDTNENEDDKEGLYDLVYDENKLIGDVYEYSFEDFYYSRYYLKVQIKTVGIND